MLERVWRQGNLLALLVGMSVDTATMENSMEVSYKTKKKKKKPYGPAIPLLATYPEKNMTQKDMHPSVHWSTVYNIQDIEAT